MTDIGKQSDAGVDADSDSDSDTDTGSDTDADSDSNAGTDSDADTDSDGDSDADTDSNTDSDSDIDTDADTDSDSDTDIDTDTDSDTTNCEAVSESGKFGTIWIKICGGTFYMGSSLNSDEQPIHKVDVPDFWMLKTEVTVAQYKECVDAGVCTTPATSGDCSESNWGNWNIAGREDHPVNCVSWQQAWQFCDWIHDDARLPSESEWEFAARSRGLDINYPWGDQAATCDWAVIQQSDAEDYGCGVGSTWPTCSKSAGNTEQGLCDMAGNVWELVQDYYHETYAGAPTDGSAWDTGTYRVRRGGSFYHDAINARAANRDYVSLPSGWYVGLGIRCAR